MSALAFARLPRPQTEAYLGSVTERFERVGKPLNALRYEGYDGDRALGDAGCSIFCVDVVEMEIRDDDNILGSITNTPKTCEKRRNENLAGIVVERVSRNSHIPA